MLSSQRYVTNLSTKWGDIDSKRSFVVLSIIINALKLSSATSTSSENLLSCIQLSFHAARFADKNFHLGDSVFYDRKFGHGQKKQYSRTELNLTIINFLCLGS